MTLDPVLLATLRVGLSLLLAVSALHKLRDLAAFRAALANYRLLPSFAVAPAAAAIAGAELAIAGALLVPELAVGAVGAASLLALYTAAIGVNLARGRRSIDCGCMGPGRRRPLGGELVSRNALLLVVAGLCALPAAPRALLWIDFVTLGAAVAVAALLYVAIDTSLANAARLRASRSFS